MEGNKKGKRKKRKKNGKERGRKGGRWKRKCVCGEQSFISLLCYSRIKDFSNSSLK